jgi:hypothetical protein
MPQLNFVNNLAAGAVDVNPLSGWTYEYLPWPAHVRILIGSVAPATPGQVTAAVYSGSECIQAKSHVSGGPPARAIVAGQLPTELDVPPIDFQAPAGDRVQLLLGNADAGTKYVQGTVILTPIR